ncbi:MAG: bifunctional enoyl-CoA hydratase/phosphate acetyltransferase [Synergistales bacterium]|nr:bifunctional enoyl-CoA hydratase/phosphate acetyltransferase [Synergistales bacterium]
MSVGLSSLEPILESCSSGATMRIALAAAADGDALLALDEARERGIADATLVGDIEAIKRIAAGEGIDPDEFELLQADSPEDAAEKAVQLVSGGEADALMKGMVKTSTLLKAVLNKEWGLRTGKLLSHMFLMEVPAAGAVYGLTDGGQNMYPDLGTKAAITENAVRCFHALGVERPRVAALAAVETVNPDMPCTLDAAALAQMNRRGQLPDCLVDGPLALDNAVSLASARHKGIDSEVAGDADILLVPDIEAGNMMGKVILSMASGRGAGVLLGARKPVILTSRVDSEETKLASIATGAYLSREMMN